MRFYKAAFLTYDVANGVANEYESIRGSFFRSAGGIARSKGEQHDLTYM